MSVSVLFVCLGNICRSPTAHAVFEGIVEKAGLSDRIVVDSCGTGSWHIGFPPDRRSAAAAAERGYDLSALRARQLCAEDFSQFDYLLAMDVQNLQDINAAAPEPFAGHAGLFLDFAQAYQQREVPDPYYGGEQGFELVLDMVEDASAGLLQHLQQKLDVS